MLNKSANNSRLRYLITITIAIVAGYVLLPLATYFVSPNRALFEEAGWLSYSGDRSSRIGFLLWYGADPNTYVQRGYTALHTAVHWESLESVEQLINAGAEVNMPTANGSRLPLDIACGFWEDDTNLIQLLIANGAERKQSHTRNFDGEANPSECFD